MDINERAELRWQWNVSETLAELCDQLFIRRRAWLAFRPTNHPPPHSVKLSNADGWLETGRRILGRQSHFTDRPQNILKNNNRLRHFWIGHWTGFWEFFGYYVLCLFGHSTRKLFNTELCLVEKFSSNTLYYWCKGWLERLYYWMGQSHWREAELHSN